MPTVGKGPESDHQDEYQPWDLPQLTVDVDNQSDEKVWHISKENVENLKLPTAEEIEAIRETARKEGYEQGRQEGYKAGESEIKVQVKNLQNCIEQLIDPTNAQRDRVNKILTKALIAITKEVVKRELVVDSSVCSQLVEEILCVLPLTAKEVKIYLNQNDIFVIEQCQAINTLIQEHYLILPSSKVAPGGCLVETSDAIFDATVDTRFQEIVSSIYDVNSDKKGSQEIGHPLEKKTDFILDTVKVEVGEESVNINDRNSES